MEKLCKHWKHSCNWRKYQLYSYVAGSKESQEIIVSSVFVLSTSTCFHTKTVQWLS